jgi:hypothetical protein
MSVSTAGNSKPDRTNGYKLGTCEKLAASLYAKAVQIRKIDKSFESDLTSIVGFICWVNEQGYLINEYTAKNGQRYSFSEVRLINAFKPLVAPRSVTVGASPRIQRDLKSPEWFVRPTTIEFATPDEMLAMQEAFCAALRISLDESGTFILSDVRIDVSLDGGERYAYGDKWYCADGQFGAIPVKLEVALYQDRVMNDSVAVALDEYVNGFYESIRKCQAVRK